MDDGNGGTDYATSEDGTYQQATYQATGGGSGTLTVTGLIGSSALATVSGNGLNGYLQNGNYGDLVQSGSTSVSLSFNGRSYTTATATTTYTVDLPNGQLNSSTATTFSGPGGSFTVAANGDITGSEFGYVVNDNWYVNSSYSTSADLWTYDRHYTSYVSETTYSKDGSGAVVSSTVQTYSGSQGSFTIDAIGVISGSESGFVADGSWYLSYVSTGSVGIALTFNGRNYTTATTTTTYSPDVQNRVMNASSVTTYSGDGGSFTVDVNGVVSGSESGWVENGNWHLSTTASSSFGVGLSFNGRYYNTGTVTVAYTADVQNRVMNSSSVTTYSGGSGSFNVDANGVISGSESGFIVNGNWYVNSSMANASNLTLPNGHVYSSSIATTYGLDSNGQVVATTIETYSGGNGSFTVAADGTLSGSETGYYRNGSWYLNGTSTDSSSYTSPSGNVYTTRSSSTTYTLDGNGQVVGSTIETYNGPGGTFTIDASGVISGAESGYRVNGSLYVNGSTSRPGGGTLTLFGTTYTGTGGSDWASYDSSGNTTSSGSSDSYQSAEGGYASVWSGYSAGTLNQGMSGWDYYVGSFYSDNYGNLTFEQRYGPSFQPGQLWINQTLVNWQGGTVDSSGTVTDTYGGSDTQGASLTLVISGSRRSYATSAGSVNVSINGGGAGTLSLAGGFSLATGYDVQASDPNRSTPLFAGPALWVNGSQLPFSGGWEDSSGHRTDRYATSGGWLTLVGSTATPTTATVQVGWNSTIYGGNFYGGSFAVGDDLTIATVPPDSGPPALWAAGRLYVKQAGQNRYVCTFTASDGTVTATYYLNLSGADATHYTLNGNGAGGTLAGTFDASAGGVFLMTQI